MVGIWGSHVLGCFGFGRVCVCVCVCVCVGGGGGAEEVKGLRFRRWRFRA